MRIALAAGLFAAFVAAPSAFAAQSPVGELLAADCAGIEGWTHDPDIPLEITDVHLYFGGPAGDPAAVAIVVRADTMLPAGCDPTQCEHGFVSALPMSLLDELEHVVHAYGIDLSGDPNLELLGSPITFSCPAPPIVGGEKRHVVSPEALAAWQFSTFFDRLIIDDALLVALPDAAPIDAAPVLAVAEGPDPTVWLLDGGYRRFVDPQVAGAWRMDLATATVMPAADLVAMPEGTPLRPRPVLIQGTDPAVYLLDDHQCVLGDPDPACREPEGTTGEGDDDGDDTGVPAEDGSGSGSGGEATTGADGGATAGSGLDTGATTGPELSGGRGGEGSGCGCESAPVPSAEWLVGTLLLMLSPSGRRRR